jgi:oligo-1,6-glucosidase
MTKTTSDEAWFRRAVVYQIYPRSFQDSDGDGIGDLRGVLSRLDYIEALGVEVVWLSPIYPSPQADNGYDISDYQDIDPVFGTLADLDELVAALHARGMKLVMDLVVNHTSDRHDWFRASRSSRSDPRRDWYVWRPARAGREPGTPGAEPNNWGAAFSGPAWTYDEATGEYYLHLFSPQQPDLNWENPEVRAAVHEMMRWWLDRGVDGFRMDVINMISKTPGLPDGPYPTDPGTGKPYTRETAPAGVHGAFGPHVIDGPRIHEFLQEMHREVFADRDGTFLTVGEMPATTVEEAALYTDPARREVDMVFQFEHVDLDHGPGGKFDPGTLDLRDLKRSLGRWQDGLAEVGWNSLYWNNHDQPRIVSRWGDDSPQHRVASARALAAVLHLHRGTPYVYQGEELGMTNTEFAALEEYRDIEILNHWRESVDVRGGAPDLVFAGLGALNRDNARTPVLWDDSENAGFTEGVPWIKVNARKGEINAASQLDDPESVLAFYRELIALRRERAVVSDGDFRMLLPEDRQVYAFLRTLGDERLLVVANLSPDPATARLPMELDGARPLLTSLPAARDARVAGSEIALAPWDARVLELVAPAERS